MNRISSYFVRITQASQTQKNMTKYEIIGKQKHNQRTLLLLLNFLQNPDIKSKQVLTTDKQNQPTNQNPQQTNTPSQPTKKNPFQKRRRKIFEPN